MKLYRIALLALLLPLFAAAQAQTAATPSTPLQSVALPDYIFGGISYNQFGSPVFAGVFSALEPESQSLGLLASESIDLQPVQYTDPKTGKTGYVLAASVRFGQHKILLNTATPQPAGAFKPSFVLALGGDAGAAFSNSSTAAGAPSTISVGFSGSFTLSAFYRFKPHWAAGVAVRALYLPGVGPNGSGAINPVVEPGIVYCK